MNYITIFKNEDQYIFIRYENNIEIGSAQWLDKKTLLQELSDQLEQLGELEK